MRRTPRRPRLPTGLARACVFFALLAAGAAGRAWALPGRAPLGQTIPPPPTATVTSAVSLPPTATWTPRPTWTQVATQPPAPPTATTGPAAGQPAATQSAPAREATPAASVPAPGLTATSALPPPTVEPGGTPSPSLPALSPTPPYAGPIPLAFEVVVAPQVAGPQDVVQFILQVANLGYGPVDSVQVDVTFADDLLLQSVECPRCTVDCSLCQGGGGPAKLELFIGLLPAGEQLIAPVHWQVAGDAWPGQSLHTDWTLTATGLPAQVAQAQVVLPPARLPATGGR